MDPVGVSELEHDLRLVERDKMRNTAEKMRRHHAREPRKAFCRPAILPAAGFLQRLRQFPVIERHPRRHAVLQAAIYHTVIVGKVAQGDHRLYPVPTTLRKQFLVKTQAIFVRGVLFPGRIDPRP